MIWALGLELWGLWRLYDCCAPLLGTAFLPVPALKEKQPNRWAMKGRQSKSRFPVRLALGISTLVLSSLTFRRLNSTRVLENPG